MEAQLTPWWEDHTGGHLCDAVTCLERVAFYRYVTIAGHEFRQLACIKHADKENDFCEHCGHYMDGRETCPHCHRNQEEHAAE